MCEEDGAVKGFVIEYPEKYFEEICAPTLIEDDQKPADKIEPKFKVGDWVKHIYTEESFLINYMDDNTYCMECIDGDISINDIDIVDKLSILWTIQDAKDGDVLEFGDHGRLVIGIVSHVNKVTGKVDVNCLLEDNNFKLGNYYALDTIKPHPATIKQRDLLFQKMKEAGCEWDVERKELKNIDDKK